MLKFLFSVLLTLNLLYPVNANLIAAFDFETRESTPETLRKAWRAREGKYGSALVIGNRHSASSKINRPPVVVDHTVSFVAWVKIKNAEKDGRPLCFSFYGLDRNNILRSSRGLDVEQMEL